MNYVSLITVLSILFTGNPKRVEVPLAKFTFPRQMVDLGERGFILKTSKLVPFTKNLDWKLRYYSTDLTLKWEADITAHDDLSSSETSPLAEYYPDQLVATRVGDYVYHVERTSGILRARKMYLTQVDKQGKVIEHQVSNEIIQNMNGNKMAVVCSDEHLVYLTGEKSKPGKPNLLTFHRWKHSNLEYSRVSVELPFEDKQSTSWQYLTHSPEKIWVMQKTISKDDKSYLARLISLNWEGKQLDEILLRDNLSLRMLKGVKYQYVPYTSQDQSARYQLETEFGIDSDPLTNNYTETSAVVDKMVEGSVLGIALDEEKNTVYTYAYIAKKKFAGYFITTFDLEGNKKWTYTSKPDDPVLTNKKLVKMPDYRATYLVPLKHGFRIHFSGLEEVNSVTFNDAGKITDRFNNEFWMVTFDSYYACLPENLPGNKYIKEYGGKKSFYRSTMDEEHPVIIHHEKYKLTLLSW